MAIQTEVWQSFVVDQLYDSNPFLQFCMDDSEYVNNKTVHIPNAGSNPSVTRNRSSYPATAAQRTDADVNYTIDEFTTDPVHVTDIEETETAYNKMDNVFGQASKTLAETAGDWVLYNWRPGGSTENTHFVYTTGGNETGHATAATGNRKKLLAADLESAMAVMDKLKVPRTGRYLIIDWKMYQQLLTSLGYQAARAAAAEADMAAGEVLRYAGFRIMAPRSKVLYATANLSSTRTPGHAGAATDSALALAWQVDAVAKAVGTVKMFEDEDNPLYYGSIISALLRSGGRKRRNDNYGVLAILQATP